MTFTVYFYASHFVGFGTTIKHNCCGFVALLSTSTMYMNESECFHSHQASRKWMTWAIVLKHSNISLPRTIECKKN
jgi:hypothetical protein